MPVGPVGKYDHGEDRRMINSFREDEFEDNISDDVIHVTVTAEELETLLQIQNEDEYETEIQSEFMNAPVSAYDMDISEVPDFIMACINIGDVRSVIDAIDRIKRLDVELHDSVINAIIDFSEEATSFLFSG